MEELYDIPNIENYKINRQGDVWSVKSKKFLNKLSSGRGYVYYILYNGNKHRSYFRHTLLCMTFKPVDNYENMTVDHINGIPGDDRLENIEFVTIKENIKRYRNKFKTKEYKPVVVRYCLEDKEIEYSSFIDAAKALNVHRYEVLRRLGLESGFVFKDYTQIKYKCDGRPFLKFDDYEKAREKYNNVHKVRLYNHFTNEERVFNSCVEVSYFLKLKPSTISVRLNTEENKVMTGGWELKYYYDDTPWSSLTEVEKIRLKHGAITTRPVIVIDTKKSIEQRFNSIHDAAKFYNMSPSSIHYRISKNSITPDENGLLYKYLDEYLTTT